ncbi:MAG: DUF420 domain-containing protein [Bacteroidota bacterium]
MIEISDLPTVNATLNATSAVLLLVGHRYIKRGKMRPHKLCMISAIVVSTLFLVSYLTYHFEVGSVSFQGQGWVRPVYFSILISHTILAVAIVPLVVLTLLRALKERFDKHARIARWTYPIWLYVSVTGVIVYVMLYHLFRSP